MAPLTSLAFAMFQALGPSAPVAPVTTVPATLATEGIIIDGRDTDPVWRLAPTIKDFRQFQPVEDGDPSFRTEAKVAYDSHNFYVFIRAYDPHPDSILTLLARRDFRTASDQLKIIIDAYHDKRTGYEFAVNPAGVRRDYVIYDDSREDSTWDGVWDVATTIDSLGWTAEFRIPLSQMRFTPGESNTFGFGIWRDIQRLSERTSWPLWRVSVAGVASQLGEVTDLQNLAPPRRLELSPYVLAKSAPRVSGSDISRTQNASIGGDVKYGITSNLTLDATVNPDFGQVEADPAVLNLSAFETFFQERRPFFVSGSGVFQFNINCSQVNCSGENLFYSRRIGRGPQLAGRYGDAASATASTILGAAKLTGRLPSGLRIGVIEAYTARESGTLDRTIEPSTNYGVLRAQQDLGGGETTLGFMATSVNRNVDEWTVESLRRNAYVGAIDFRHRFLNKQYQIKGVLSASRVSGSAEAIAGTQLSSVHYYQRPDDGVAYDPTRTTLTGDAQELYLGKVGGQQLRFETSFQRRSAGYEVNDLGFLQQAGHQSWNTWVGLQGQRPASFYRQAYWNFNWWQDWDVEGLPLERAFNTNAHAQLRNRWWLNAGGTLSGFGTTFCDRCTRGGPALRNSTAWNVWMDVSGDDRPMLVPEVFASIGGNDDGHSWSASVSPYISFRVGSPLRGSLAANFRWNRDDNQWFGNFQDEAGDTHHAFARLTQHTASMSLRVDYTITPTLSVQGYGEPFVSEGTYSAVRELDNPRAAAYSARYKPYLNPAVADDPGGFNFKQFRSNLVVRWEYRPGSALFLVWNQGRQDSAPLEGSRSILGDFRDLFRARADNTFLIKASYWINR